MYLQAFWTGKQPVMWSETVSLRTRPVWDQKIGLGLGFAHCGLGLGLGLVILILVVVLRIWSCLHHWKQQFQNRVSWVYATIVRRTASEHSLLSRTSRNRTKNNIIMYNNNSRLHLLSPTQSPDVAWFVVTENGRCSCYCFQLLHILFMYLWSQMGQHFWYLPALLCVC